MALPLPGADTLGYGFNIFGQYDSSSKISPLFDMQFDASREWRSGNVTYLLPQNASFDPSPSHNGDTYVFSSRQKVQEHFAAKASVSASYGPFSGEFEAAYSQTKVSDDQYDYALVEANSIFWSLTLKDQSANALASWVTSDPDYINIPDTYNEGNRDLFFRFFDKYGTHYVVGVTVGSRLYYSSLILKSYNYSSQDISVKMKAEYDGVFVKAGAEAQAAWQKAGEDWSSQRSVTVGALGGNNVILNALAPGYPDNFNDEYKMWLESAAALPAVIDFQLAEVANLFSSGKAQAVKQAITAYTRTRLYVEAKTGSCVVLYNAEPVLPAGGGDGVLGFQLVAIDRKSLRVAFAKSYAITAFYSGYEERYTTALSDIRPYRNGRYLIAFTTWSMFGTQYPIKDFSDFLNEIGAGIGLQGWFNVHDLKNQNPAWYCCDVTHVNYCLLGYTGIGQGNGFEVFQRAGSCDTGKGHWYDQNGWYDLPAPLASIEVDLFKLAEADALHTVGLSYRAKRSKIKVISNNPMVRAHHATADAAKK